MDSLFILISMLDNIMYIPNDIVCVLRANNISSLKINIYDVKIVKKITDLD